MSLTERFRRLFNPHRVLIGVSVRETRPGVFKARSIYK
jgi:hypothetical protein